MVNKLYIVTPRGFCAGVEMAIKALTWMLKIYDEPVYCYHEIVHNDWIVEKFKKKNVIFIEDTDELPKDSIVMLSAHGTAPDIAGHNIINPTATILSACMMLDYLGFDREGKKLKNALASIYEAGVLLTRDQGGKATTTQFCDALKRLVT